MPDLWRISRHRDLTGQGGYIASARWHRAGRPIVYLAECPPGALLEVLVHLELNAAALPPSYTLLHVRVPVDVTVTELTPKGETWRTNLEASRDLGDAWLREGRTALARVPSAIMPHTWNVLLNPLHPDATAVQVAGAESAAFDPRLLR